MNRKILLSVIGTLLLTSSLASATPWTKNMQSLFLSLQELLVLTVDEARFNDPKNTARIETAAENLAKSAHDAAKMRGKAPDPDPSVGIFGALLQDEARRAQEAYRSGHRDYARSLFRNMASTCIACHSRSAAGSKLSWDFSTGFAEGLPLFQQVELLAAGRSFEAALATLDKILGDDEFAKKRPLDWNRALRFALAITVRIERDPSKALSLLERATAAPGVPQFTRLDIRDWKRSLEAWKAEKVAKKTRPSTESQLNAEAHRLLELARAAQRYPMDRSGDILYLRATSMLHQQLQVAPDGPLSADALFRLGQSYEVLRDFELWNLGEVYFEACINRAPHTKTAESCFRQLEQSIIAGYSGSGGTQLPESATRKLDGLRVLATTTPRPGKKVQ